MVLGIENLFILNIKIIIIFGLCCGNTCPLCHFSYFIIIIYNVLDISLLIHAYPFDMLF